MVIISIAENYAFRRETLVHRREFLGSVVVVWEKVCLG
jgi:hypothetical protein